MQRFNGNYHKMRLVEEKFIIKKEHGIVICKQKYYIPSSNTNHFYVECRDIDVTGVAICSKNDTFDETAGRRIAQTKANAKAYMKYARWARNIYVEVNKSKEKYTNTLKVALELALNEKNKVDANRQ